MDFPQTVLFADGLVSLAGAAFFSVFREHLRSGFPCLWLRLAIVLFLLEGKLPCSRGLLPGFERIAEIVLLSADILTLTISHNCEAIAPVSIFQLIYTGIILSCHNEALLKCGIFVASTTAKGLSTMPQCGNVWGGFFNSTDDRPAPFWREKVAGTDTFTHCEFGATQGKFDLAVCAKKNGLDAIHDTVHEMARDEARHGKALQGLLERYFK